MRAQKFIQFYACLDTDTVAGYPPNTYAGEPIPDDAICEVMNTSTNEIYKMFKMDAGQWHDYIVGEGANPESLYVEWVGYPTTPTACPTKEYPSQVIMVVGELTRLYCATNQIVYAYGTPGNINTYPDSEEVVKGFALADGEWLSGFDVNMSVAYPDNPMLKSNTDIVNLASGAVVFSKSI
jgi:hypothetical protein